MKRRNRIRAHNNHVTKTYELSPEDYAAILASQDGRCFVCRKAKGAKKFLAVDHDHHAHDGETPPPHPREMGCRRCVRCLACNTCNRIVLGRYDVDALVRAIIVLTEPPAQKVLRDLAA
jgi:hypothetical protein